MQCPLFSLLMELWPVNHTEFGKIASIGRVDVCSVGYSADLM